MIALCVRTHGGFSMQSIQNLGLAVISIVAGKIVDDRGYLALEVFFQICLCGEWSYMRTF